jgi:hypothetical protein
VSVEGIPADRLEIGESPSSAAPDVGSVEFAIVARVE